VPEFAVADGNLDRNQEWSVTTSFDECTDCSVLEVEGALRTPIKSELSERVAALLDGGQRRIVLDLARVSDIDAAGVGELVHLSNMAASVRCVFQISRPTSEVRQLLDATGLSSFVIG
jgi:anti-anti-sigma factor